MRNVLKEMEKDFKTYAKTNKLIKYSLATVVTFLMTGVIGVSEEIEIQKKIIDNSVEKTKLELKKLRLDNNKKLRSNSMELIQLEEQGNQVVKSPWDSWQFAIGYDYSMMNSKITGHGDKEKLYGKDGILKRNDNIFLRYAHPLESENYRNAMKTFKTKGVGFGILKSTETYDEDGYGLTQTRIAYIKPIEFKLGEIVTPKAVTKNPIIINVNPVAVTVQEPATIGAITVTTPGGFNTSTVSPAVAPLTPLSPSITIPNFVSKVKSNGNGPANVIDLSNHHNGVMEMIAVTSGDFKVERLTDVQWSYTYTGYSGINAFRDSGTLADGVLGVAGMDTWQNLQRGTTITNGDQLGFQKLVAEFVGTGLTDAKNSTMLSNAKFLYTRKEENAGVDLGEFAHLDIHGAAPAIDQRTKLETATNGLSNKQKILDAYDDAGNNINWTNPKIYTDVSVRDKWDPTLTPGHVRATTDATSNRYAWINSGKITIEGGNTSVTNNYDHYDVSQQGNHYKSMVINTGDIVFQPYYDSTLNKYYQNYTAAFVMSQTGGWSTLHMHHIMYNSGSIKMYTNTSSIFLAAPDRERPLSIVNRGILEMYGEKSAGIYLKKDSTFNSTLNDLYFVSKDFAFDTSSNTVTAGNYNPIKIFGDKSIGFYGETDKGITKGDFAINIGDTGKGNQTFSTPLDTDGTAITTGGVLTNYNINTLGSTDEIEGTVGIVANAPIDLTSHKIQIFDKTIDSLGVILQSNILVNLGGGSIDLNAGTKNTAIAVDGKGTVKSSGDVNINGGNSNASIYAKGGSVVSGETNNIEVQNINIKDTRNTVAIFATNGAKVKLGDAPIGSRKYGLNISNATVDSDVSSTNPKDSGAVFATGAGTEVTLNRSVAPIATSPNISITGVKLSDADRNVGFGLYVKDGAKINAKNNYIKVINGGTGIASTGKDSLNNASIVDFREGILEYKGNGYAVYTDGTGKVDLRGATLILDGSSSAYELSSSVPITTDLNTRIKVNSDDVVVFRMNSTGTTYNTTGLQAGLGLPNIGTIVQGGTASNYKIVSADDITLQVGDLDKSGTDIDLSGTPKGDGYFYSKFFAQRVKATILANKSVLSTINSDKPVVVGFEASSNRKATDNTKTKIDMQSGSKVIADRINSGTGAIGLFVNYGQVTTDGTSGHESLIEVEKGANIVNDGGVGIFAVNGSTVSNGGKISVGGNSAFGILGMAYREASSGVMINEFGGKTGEGTIVLNNSGTLDLSSGLNNIGIYGSNNKLPLSSSNLTIGNTGTIVVGNSTTGKVSIGMYAKGAGTISNSGNITVGTGGIGIYNEYGNTTVTGGTMTVGAGSTAYRLNLDTGSVYSNNSSGTIKVIGDKSTMYNVKGADNISVTSTFTDNSTHDVSAIGNGFTYYNIDNSTLKFDRGISSTLGLTKNNFTYISGKNSIIKVLPLTVDVRGTSNIGIYLNGKHSSLSPTQNGIENAGTFIFGDSSAGIYSKSGGNVLNKGALTVGKNSTAIYVEGNDLDNSSTSGNITIGDNSTGIYVKGGVSVKNGGTITGASAMSGTKGIVLETVNETTSGTITNSGAINISGNKALGIYSKYASTILNNASVTMTSDGESKDNPNIGIYSGGTTGTITNNAPISLENNGIAIYGSNVNNNLASITVKDAGVGIYSIGGNVTTTGALNIGGVDSVGIYTSGTGQNVNVSGSMNMGPTSIGMVNIGNNNTIISNITSVNLSSNNMYIYSSGSNGTITNNTLITATGDKNYGVYGSGTVQNNKDIIMNTGYGNTGIYITAGSATNGTSGAGTQPIISVGGSNVLGTEKYYGIGMLAMNGTITNYGTINVDGDKSIGMYGKGEGTIVENRGIINLNSNESLGIYIADKAIARNYGTIQTVGSGRSKNIGIVIGKDSILENELGSSIIIDSSEGAVFYNNGGLIKNYGLFTITAKGGATETASAKIPSISISNKKIDSATGTITIDGISVPIITVSSTDTADVRLEPLQVPAEYTISTAPKIGMYINTSGTKFTNPIGGLSNIAGLETIDLIIGSEVASRSTGTSLRIDQNDPIIEPYNRMIRDNSNIDVKNHVKVYPGSLTWLATFTPIEDPKNTGKYIIGSIYLQKRDYTEFANDDSTFNFTSGLDQRYGKEALGTNENNLYQKLNGIGQAEKKFLFQAFDQMKGYQYSNTQTRILQDSKILKSGFDDLFSWDAKSKDSNKIKLIGGQSEYKNDTAGVIDYTTNNVGVVYLREDQTLKLGQSQGWYTGLLYDKFKFQDIGESTEESVSTTLGLYKSISFDNNNSLNLTIKGDLEAGQRQMYRRYLVVDEIFNARSTYYTYGISMENELSKSIRLSKGWSFKPYGKLSLGYGTFSDIKENKGEMRLEVESNDYYSVKPSLGAELSYKQEMMKNLNLTFKLDGSYGKELGETTDVENKVKIRYTTAKYYTLRKDKPEEGSGKFDVSLGLENEKIGVTLNVGYNTLGEEIQSGLGLRVIF